MPLQPIPWAKHDGNGRHADADGSRLHNMYTIQPAGHQSDLKTPYVIYSVPGLKEYLRVPPFKFVRNGKYVTPMQGIHALKVIESPIYGNWIVGLSSESQFFWWRIPDKEAPMDIYNPLKVGGSNLITLTPGDAANFTHKVSNYTVQNDKRLNNGEAGKLVTNGRYIMWITPRTVRQFDLRKAMEKIHGGNFPSVSRVAAPTPKAYRKPYTELPDDDWVDCEYIGGYFFIATRQGQLFHSLLNDITFDQLEFSFASAKYDRVVALHSYRGVLYVIGSETTERWFDAGKSTFSFQRDNASTLDIGSRAKNSVKSMPDGVYLVSNEGMVVRIRGNSWERISSDSVEYWLREKGQTSSPKKLNAWTYVEEGQHFYCLYNFDDPLAKVYNMNTGLWHEMEHKKITCCERYGIYNLVGDGHSSSIYNMSLSHWSSNGLVMTRLIIPPVLSLNSNRARMKSVLLDLDKFEFSNIKDSNESIELSVKTDSRNHNFFAVGTKLLYKLNPRYKWNRLGQFRDSRQLRFIIKSKQSVVVLGGYADIEMDMS